MVFLGGVTTLARDDPERSPSFNSELDGAFPDGDLARIVDADTNKQVLTVSCAANIVANPSQSPSNEVGSSCASMDEEGVSWGSAVWPPITLRQNIVLPDNQSV